MNCVINNEAIKRTLVFVCFEHAKNVFVQLLALQRLFLLQN